MILLWRRRCRAEISSRQVLRVIIALHLLLESVDGLSSFLLRAEALTADLLSAQTALPAARLTHTHTHTHHPCSSNTVTLFFTLLNDVCGKLTAFLPAAAGFFLIREGSSVREGYEL